jgi:cell division protein FtsN
MTIAGIVIFIIIAAAGAAWYLGYIPLKKEPVAPPPPPPVEIVETDTAQVVEPEEDLIEEVVQETVPEKPAGYDTDPNVAKGFYIVIGSYQSKRNAERFAQKMKADIETKVLYFEGSGLHRVTCGHYKNIHAAYNDRISIRDLEGCSEAWVLENR